MKAQTASENRNITYKAIIDKGYNTNAKSRGREKTSEHRQGIRQMERHTRHTQGMGRRQPSRRLSSSEGITAAAERRGAGGRAAGRRTAEARRKDVITGWLGGVIQLVAVAAVARRKEAAAAGLISESLRMIGSLEALDDRWRASSQGMIGCCCFFIPILFHLGNGLRMDLVIRLSVSDGERLSASIVCVKWLTLEQKDE